MKKIVKANDVRKMVKMFNLSEDEQYWLNDIADDVNAQKSESRYGTRLSFLMSPECCTLDADKYNAICSLLMYFGLKVQETVGQFFQETVDALALTLNANEQWIKRIFRGMSFANKRWDSKVYLAEQCGLNVLELTK